jgi:hypothetical protein
MFLLYLHLGLRRGEAMILPVAAIAEDYDPVAEELLPIRGPDAPPRFEKSRLGLIAIVSVPVLMELPLAVARIKIRLHLIGSLPTLVRARHSG